MTPAQPTAHNTSAIVIGLDTLPGLQTARILAGHRIPVIAIASDPEHHCCRTNVCDEIHYANARWPEFLAKRNEIAATLDHRPILYPCLDPAVLIIPAHCATKKRLRPGRNNQQNSTRQQSSESA